MFGRQNPELLICWMGVSQPLVLSDSWALPGGFSTSDTCDLNIHSIQLMEEILHHLTGVMYQTL